LDNSASPLKIGAPGTRSETQPIGEPRTVLTSNSQLPWVVPVNVQANGAYAPGFSAGEVVRTDSGHRRGLAAAPCASPGTDFWFQDVALGPDRQTTLYLANADTAPATVNLTLIGPDGTVDTGTNGQNIQLAPNAFQQILISSLPSQPLASPTAAALRVTTQAGRVAATVLDIDIPTVSSTANGNGMDFIPAQSPTAPEQTMQVIPGITAGVHSRIDLTLTAVGSLDASIDKLEWVAGNKIVAAVPPSDPVSGDVKLAQPLAVPKGKTITVDLSKIPDPKENGAFRITSSGGPVLAGIRVISAATPGQPTDTAYLAPASQLAGQAIVVDNKQGGKAVSELLLTAFGPKGATIKVTTVGGDNKPSVDTFTVPGDQTTMYTLKVPPGQNEFTAVVELQAGSDPLYGARAMIDQPAGGYAITEQVLASARLTASVPPVAADLSGAVDR
jgi:hypothetical protein